jgi:hypothetical protein
VKPSVSFDEADDDVSTPLASAVAFAEHGIGLPDTRSGAQVYAEVAGRLDPILAILGRRRFSRHQFLVNRGVWHRGP